MYVHGMPDCWLDTRELRRQKSTIYKTGHQKPCMVQLTLGNRGHVLLPDGRLINNGTVDTASTKIKPCMVLAQLLALVGPSDYIQTSVLASYRCILV
jgi:hypothetical protein